MAEGQGAVGLETRAGISVPHVGPGRCLSSLPFWAWMRGVVFGVGKEHDSSCGGGVKITDNQAVPHCVPRASLGFSVVS